VRWQREVVRQVEGLFALVDQLDVRLAKARGQVEKLTPSILARAFAGQLAPQNLTDEPADKLLKRIRGESALSGVQAISRMSHEIRAS
jgi:type I restriction enzyme, S subunit